MVDSEANKYIEQKKSNLIFFRESYPKIYSQVKDLDLKRVELVISPVEADVDLTVDGVSLYGGKARLMANQEIRTFVQERVDRRTIKSLPPLFEDGVNAKKFAGSYLKSAASCSSLVKSEYTCYEYHNVIPMVVVFGVGLGFHLELLSRRVDVADLIIVEPDLEVFAASLFTCDWKRICEAVLKRRGRRLSFVLGGREKSENQYAEFVELEIRKHAPLFPAFTIYYGHNRKFRDVIQEIQDRSRLYFSMLGNYDDEVRRFNNTVHNFRQNIGCISPQNSIKDVRPVFIVGSGPSIDARISEIQRYKDDAIIVSAGTGLRVLLSHDILPDYHVELDPRYEMVQVLEQLDREKLKKITLLAIHEVNPAMFGLFGDYRIFLKDQNAVPVSFGFEAHAFSHCNPTCTNSALSIFSSLGFRNLFLFGADYGFANKQESHSKSSIYGESSLKGDEVEVERVARKTFIGDRGTVPVESVFGGYIETWPDFLAAKHAVENLNYALNDAGSEIGIYNCSDGAKINGVTWLSQAEFVSSIEELISSGQILSEKPEIGSFGVDLALPNMDELLHQLAQELLKRCRETADLVRSFDPYKPHSLVFVGGKMARVIDEIKLSSPVARATPAMRLSQHMLKGSLVFFSFLGLAHAFAENHPSPREFARCWKAHFLQFLRHLPQHFDEHFSVYGKTPKGDPWLVEGSNDQELWS